MQRVFVHGLGQTPAAWEKTVRSLGDGAESLCPDLAELVGSREAAYPALYESFCGFCGRLEGPLDLCGLSLGGVLALNYAIGQPERVRSLVLIAAQYRMPGNLLRLQNLLFRLMPEGMFRQTGFEKRDVIRLCGSMMDLDFRGSLGRVACPVLVLCGERDAANRKASGELAGLLKNAEFRLIKGAGHEANTDAPERLAEALRAFYARAFPPPGAGKSVEKEEK